MAYQFFANPKVSSERIIRAHARATAKRMRGERIILAVQDTTVLDFPSHDGEGLGPIGAKSTRKLSVHSCLAGRADGTPLGLLHQEFWACKNAKADRDKESARWIETMRAVAPLIPDGARLLMLGDRENDLFEFFSAVAEDRVDAIVRAVHDRRLQRQHPTLAATLAAAPHLGECKVTVPKKPSQRRREATLALGATSVELPPPRTCRDPHKDPVRLYAVCADETDPPPDVQNPIRWILLTTLPVADAEQAAIVVRRYTLRWRIDRLHYILKTGCRTESRWLQADERPEDAVVIYSSVAWQILWLTHAAQHSPAAPCTSVLSDAEWRTLVLAMYQRNVLKDRRALEEPPPLSSAVVYIARLGGFLARRGDGDPGVETIWHGWRQLQAMAVVLEAGHPGEA